MINFLRWLGGFAPARRPTAPAPTPPAPAVLPDPDIADCPRQVFLIHNAFRRSYGLAPLAVDGRLFNSAQGWADHQAALRTMEHVDAGAPESAFAARLSAEGYAWSSCAENVAAGQPDPSAVMAAWMASPPHRANVLGAYRDAGVGVARGADGRLYWCVDFGSPA